MVTPVEMLLAALLRIMRALPDDKPAREIAAGALQSFLALEEAMMANDDIHVGAQ